MAVLLPGSRLMGQPLTVALLGVVVAVQSSAAVKDRSQRDRVVTSGPKPDKEEKEAATGLNPSSRAAIQVAVATSAATVLGEMISPDRWYWAVLTAFLVFTGVSTRGEILTRAGHRVVGTVAGVVAGVLLSVLVGNNEPLQLLLLVVSVFCAFYLVTVAYALLSFFVTVMLAMLYGLLGTFSIEVLELRIYETIAGGVVGIASAFLVFSTGTKSTMIDKVENYLDEMASVVDASIGSVVEPGRTTDLVAKMRPLDKALQECVTSAKPLAVGPTTRMRRGTGRVLRILKGRE